MMPDSFAATSDEELIDHYQRSGQRQALGILLDRYLARLRRLVFGMTAGQAEVDDLTQEVFLRVIRGLPQFKKEAKFSTWLYRVAMNTTYRYLKQRARQRVDGSAALEEPQGRSCDEPGLRVLEGEMNEQVAAALAELSPNLRAALMLMAMEGLSGNEAAAIEGCTPATMYWRLHEARKVLAQRLAVYLGSEAGTRDRAGNRKSGCKGGKKP